jgi:hypothetical protein
MVAGVGPGAGAPRKWETKARLTGMEKVHIKKVKSEK